MMRTKGQGAKAARQAVTSYQKQRQDLAAERQQQQDSRLQIQDEFRETLAALAELLLPMPDYAFVEQAAQAVDTPELINRWRLLEERSRENEARLAAIEADDAYRRRTQLLDPEQGEYLQQTAEVEQALEGTRRKLQTFNLSEFQTLYMLNYHQYPQYGLGENLKRMLSLADYREKKQLETVLSTLNYPDFSTCVADFEALKKQQETLRQTLGDWRKKAQTLTALIEERDRLVDWLDNYPTECLQVIRGALVAALGQADYEALLQTIRPEAKVLVAKCHALSKKMLYLGNTSDFLTSEIADRDDRIRSINRVISKWQTKPQQSLSDKSKWLLQIPRMKAQGTEKRICWTRTMRRNITDYDDYDDYCYMMDHHHRNAGLGFLAYDFFAYRALEAMPYEGFTRSMIGELDDFRNHFNLDRADYSSFRDLEAYAIEEDEWDELDIDEALDDLAENDLVNDSLDEETAAAAASLIDAEAADDELQDAS